MASSPFARFGAFGSFFEGPPDGANYLSLLNLHIGAEPTIRQLKRVVRVSDPDLERSVVALLSDEFGWRPQLVGAAAMIAGARSDACIEALWQALDHWCWTSPQLAAAAYRVDPEFRAKAWPRMEGRCRVAPPSKLFARMPPSPEKDRAAQGQSDPKLMAAFVALFERDHPRTEPLGRLLAAPDVAQLLSDNRDGGGEIALGWLDRLEDAMSQVPEFG